MKKIQTALLIAAVVYFLASCGPGPQLADFVDPERTDPRLYQDLFEIDPGAPFEPVQSSVVPLLPNEVLYGMLRCAEGDVGTSLWRFVDATDDYFIYIWDAGLAEGGFAYVRAGSGMHPAKSGMNAPVYEISDLMSWMKTEGWQSIKPSQLPGHLNANAINQLIQALPSSLPLWQAPNLLLMVIPSAMIYFKSPVNDGGGA